MSPEGQLEIWQGRLQESVCGRNWEEQAEKAGGGGRGAACWVVWQLVAAMGEDGGRVIRVRSSADPVSRKKGGGALLVSLRDTSFGDMSPGWGTTTKDAPWAVRLAPRLRSGAKSLSQGSVSSEIQQPPPLGRLPPAEASKAATRLPEVSPGEANPNRLDVARSHSECLPQRLGSYLVPRWALDSPAGSSWVGKPEN